MNSEVFGLLEAVFPGIGRGAEEIRRLGVPWESVSTPFLAYDDGRPVSHVGLIELPLIVMGEPRTVGTLHAVATHPEYRGRGFYRGVMEEALGQAASRYETLVLTTEHPEYFRPFGFRVVREHAFVHWRPASSAAAAAKEPDSRALRRMDLCDAGDIALLHRLLEIREPVSRVAGVLPPEKAVFCFNEGRRPLLYSPGLDVMVCLEREGSRLALFDIVGPVLPPLDALLAQVGGPTEEVTFHFSPDRFPCEARATPRVFDHDGPSYLMVRGPFPAEGEAFTLPRSART